MDIALAEKKIHAGLAWEVSDEELAHVLGNPGPTTSCPGKKAMRANMKLHASREMDRRLERKKTQRKRMILVAGSTVFAVTSAAWVLQH